jgi:hypothetical protein
MNYIIEDNIDFYSKLHKELKNEENENNENNENICLITHEPLDTNYITLGCGHKFNYIPLYNEIINQKINNNYLEIIYLKINQIKCPYCRRITNKLLPYIQHPLVTYKKGVNYPAKYCMKLHSCHWVIKSGKSKGTPCCKDAYESNFGIYCCLHQKRASRNLDDKKKVVSNSIDWTDKHYELNKKYKVKELKQILRENKKKVGGTKLQLIDRIIKIDYSVI